jgi:hypothetical protein
MRERTKYLTKSNINLLHFLFLVTISFFASEWVKASVCASSVQPIISEYQMKLPNLEKFLCYTTCIIESKSMCRCSHHIITSTRSTAVVGTCSTQQMGCHAELAYETMQHTCSTRNKKAKRTPVLCYYSSNLAPALVVIESKSSYQKPTS